MPDATTTFFDYPAKNLTYDQLINWSVAQASEQGVDINAYLAHINQTYPDADLTNFMIDEASKYMDFYQNADGTYTAIGYRTLVNDVDVPNPINSNSTQIYRGGIRQMINNGVENVGGFFKRHMTSYPSAGSFAQRASYVIGSVGGAISAVSAGITLGKVIDSSLYNLNPDFWNSVGMSSLNPETWNQITVGDDSNFAGLFNLIMGLDPDTGNSQAYMDENAMAYLAYYMKEKGVFNPESTTIEIDTDTIPSSLGINIINASPTLIEPAFIGKYGYNYAVETEYQLHSAEIFNNELPVYVYAWLNKQPTDNSCIVNWVFFSKGSFSIRSTLNAPVTSPLTLASESAVINNDTINFIRTYTYNTNFKYGNATLPATLIDYSGIGMDSLFTPATSDNEKKYIWALLFNSAIISGGSIEGITNQPNATLPNISDWNDIPSTLQSLQQQYPDLWNDALTWDNWQPDGTLVQTRYIPVAMPNANFNNDSQPTSSSSTQAQPQINPNNADSTLLQLITDVISAQKTQTSADDKTIPPVNPPDTGTGDTPTPVAPSGSASALWSVYHPTQAQVNSFGGWLWGSVFTTDIRKLFTDPIQGVISLHKIFATPVDSGSGTIVVGTLDSNVPSATVTQQYVTVDCGSIDCYEEFGNVFDYEPYTQVSCYLPFIGIVPLKTDDVMRSTIHITYGVDVFTGACLAMIEVSRDGNTVNMYQYSGVASVEYPLTNLQQSNIVSGLLSVAGGVAMAVGSGGVGFAAGAAMIGGAASAAKSSVGRSGGFSGNAGAMGIKIPYLIIERPQTKVAETFPALAGYPTNYSCALSECSGHVTVKHVHIEGINATDSELSKIESLLRSGVIV